MVGETGCGSLPISRGFPAGSQFLSSLLSAINLRLMQQLDPSVRGSTSISFWNCNQEQPSKVNSEVTLVYFFARDYCWCPVITRYGISTHAGRLSRLPASIASIGKEPKLTGLRTIGCAFEQYCRSVNDSHGRKSAHVSMPVSIASVRAKLGARRSVSRYASAAIESTYVRLRAGVASSGDTKLN